MKVLSIDIETYSNEDITKVGVYKYVDSSNFEILLFAYAFDDGPVNIVDLAQDEQIPKEVLNALYSPDVLKTAYNAQFERVCLNKMFERIFLDMDYGEYDLLDVEQWECSMVKAAMLGLPFGLDKVAKVLKLDNQKMKEGKSLINFFSKPCKPTKKNGQRTRNLPHHDIGRWELFKSYCKQDVKVEMAIRGSISWFNIPWKEKRLYYLDQKINDTGVMINKTLVDNAIAMDIEYKDRLMTTAREITGLDNPNSVAQLKVWIEKQTGIVVDSLSKGVIPDLINTIDNDDVIKVLKIRQRLSKTSVKKYQAMDRATCSDGRVRGLLQFYGANRTGRWAGRLVQVQNLPKNKIVDLDLAREIVIEGDMELLSMLYGNVPNILSQLVRTAFIASGEGRFIVADFSAIEARVIAWLAGEIWRLDVFNSHGKIYEASASQMFKVPIEEITKGSPLRQKGKVSELALGYQGGRGALIQMGALDMGLEEDELQDLVDTWRAANSKIVRLWKDIQKASIKSVLDKTVTRVKCLTFRYHKGYLLVELPSGRFLAYPKAKVERGGQFNSLRLTYEGMDQTTKQWKTIETYGGKLTENIVQAIARDCLRETMFGVAEAGYKIVMHVHDEVIIDAEDGSLEDVLEIMGRSIVWSKGLPLVGDGYETLYYLKA